MSEIKLPRLLAAAKEFNIGQETLVEFLVGKGFVRDELKPSAKLTEPMYHALHKEFHSDKVAKAKSNMIDLPKGEKSESRRKKEEDLKKQQLQQVKTPVEAPIAKTEDVVSAPQPNVVDVEEEVKPTKNTVVEKSIEQPTAKVEEPAKPVVTENEPVVEAPKPVEKQPEAPKPAPVVEEKSAENAPVAEAIKAQDAHKPVEHIIKEEPKIGRAHV